MNETVLKHVLSKASSITWIIFKMIKNKECKISYLPVESMTATDNLVRKSWYERVKKEYCIK